MVCCNTIYFVSVDVQLGHLVALILIVLRQKGHSLVVGAAGAAAAAFLGAVILAIGRTTKKKITIARIKNVMMVLIKTP